MQNPNRDEAVDVGAKLAEMAQEIKDLTETVTWLAEIHAAQSDLMVRALRRVMQNDEHPEPVPAGRPRLTLVPGVGA